MTIDVEEIKKAFERVETHTLKVSNVICTVCGCVINMDNKEKPCSHLKALAASMLEKK